MVSVGQAHETGSSYLHLRVEENQLVGRWEIFLEDLDLAIGLDANEDDLVSLDELQVRQAEAKRYVLDRLELSADERTVKTAINPADLKVESTANGENVVFDFIVADLPIPKFLQVDYRFLFDVEPQHRGLLELEASGMVHTAIFSPDDTTQVFELNQPKRVGEFLAFGWQGIWHIWIGFDHILFLLALLLPSVCYREQNQWRAAKSFRIASINVVKIVTAFTVAHSITLSVAALEWLALPSRWVESAIAASVLCAALNNLHPIVEGRAWLVAFAFGLIHGFANVLTELGLPAGHLVLALLGFNLGVEVGQLAIVGLFLPAAYLVRKSRFYTRIVLQLGSILIATIATAWMAERIGGFQLLPF